MPEFIKFDEIIGGKNESSNKKYSPERDAWNAKHDRVFHRQNDKRRNAYDEKHKSVNTYKDCGN